MMKIRELSRAEWAHALDEFSPDRRGYLATVERTSPEVVAPQIQSRPLVSVTLNPQGSGAHMIAVILHPPEDPQNTISVEHVTGVRVHETANGLAQHVEIDGGGGEHLILRLRGVTPSDMLLDGVAPGELS